MARIAAHKTREQLNELNDMASIQEIRDLDGNLIGMEVSEVCTKAELEKQFSRAEYPSLWAALDKGENATL